LDLSKFARIAHQFAHRLQLQERLTHQIAGEIQLITQIDDVVVVGQGQHLCMEMRGIRTPAMMTSSVIRGRFRDLPALRAETLALGGRR
jgi:GTP cyclohydrolase IA